MKVAVVLCLCLVTVMSTDNKDKAKIKQGLKMVRGFCQAKCQTKQAEIDGIKKGKFPESEFLKNYCSCVMGLMKIIKDGKFDPDGGTASMKSLPPVIGVPMVTAINKCRGVDQGLESGGEICFAVLKCMYNVLSPNGTFIFP